MRPSRHAFANATRRTGPSSALSSSISTGSAKSTTSTATRSATPSCAGWPERCSAVVRSRRHRRPLRRRGVRGHRPGLRRATTRSSLAERIRAAVAAERRPTRRWHVDPADDLGRRRVTARRRARRAGALPGRRLGAARREARRPRPGDQRLAARRAHSALGPTIRDRASRLCHLLSRLTRTRSQAGRFVHLHDHAPRCRGALETHDQDAPTCIAEGLAAVERAHCRKSSRWHEPAAATPGASALAVRR